MNDHRLMRATNLKVPSAPKASASPSSNSEQVVSAGAQTLAAASMLGSMLIVYPLQELLSAIPQVFEEIGKKFTKQLDEAVKEIGKL